MDLPSDSYLRQNCTGSSLAHAKFNENLAKFYQKQFGGVISQICLHLFLKMLTLFLTFIFFRRILEVAYYMTGPMLEPSLRNLSTTDNRGCEKIPMEVLVHTYFLKYYLGL